MQPVCFISHSSEDAAFIEATLLELLRAMGVKPWYSRKSIMSASDWESEIKNGLEDADCLLVVVSAQSEKSPWVRHEVNWGMEHLPGRVVPLLIDKTPQNKLHVHLDRVQAINFYKNHIEGINALIRYFVTTGSLIGSRRTAFQGEWIGTVAQADPLLDTQLNMKIILSLRAVLEEIRGYFKLEVPTPITKEKMDFEVTGQAYYHKYIQLNYRSSVMERVQFGSILMEIDDMGRTMRGRYVGYGALSRKIVSGEIQVDRA